MYVIKKDTQANTITIGLGKEAEVNSFSVSDTTWIDASNKKLCNTSLNVLVRIRNLGPKMPALLSCKDKIVLAQSKEVFVELSDYAFGVALGQSAVFYLNDLVLGGGIIS